MKKVILFSFSLFLLFLIFSCAPESAHKAILPASLENTNLEQEFNIVTRLVLIQDSVKTWTNCHETEFPKVDKFDELSWEQKYKCNTFCGYYFLYKGVLITEQGQLVEVGFLSPKELYSSCLLYDEIGSYVKVRTLKDVQVSNVPGYNLSKILMYDPN